MEKAAQTILRGLRILL